MSTNLTLIPESDLKRMLADELGPKPRKEDLYNGMALKIRRELRRRRSERIAAARGGVYTKGILDRPSTTLKPFEGVSSLNPKKEKFVIEYMASGDFKKAAAVAGYRFVHKNYLLEDPDIKTRIRQYQEEVMERMTWGVKEVLERLNEVYTLSKENGDFTNANRAIENVAKHLGMFVERTEQKIKLSQLGAGSTAEEVANDIKTLASVAGFKVVDGGKP